MFPKEEYYVLIYEWNRYNLVVHCTMKFKSILIVTTEDKSMNELLLVWT